MECKSSDCQENFRVPEDAMKSWNTRTPISEQPVDWREREDGKRALQFLQMQGFRRCDIAACNCPYWHGGNASERLTEIHEVLSEAGLKPYEKTAIVAIKELVAIRELESVEYCETCCQQVTLEGCKNGNYCGKAARIHPNSEDAARFRKSNIIEDESSKP